MHLQEDPAENLFSLDDIKFEWVTKRVQKF